MWKAALIALLAAFLSATIASGQIKPPDEGPVPPLFEPLAQSEP
jgi:hypothetical protein